MPRINIDKIRQIAGEINSSLAKLEKYADLKEDIFLASSEKIDSAKYNLIVAIEGVVDICNHIVAKIGGRAPCDYGDCFTILSELNILSKKFSERLKRMVKFRNLLVHIYWNVDNQRVYQIMKSDITDIELYLKEIHKFLQENIK